MADSASTLEVVLRNKTAWTGSIQLASLSLDAGSSWSLSGNSVLARLPDAAGIGGASVANIIGNGFTATHDSSAWANWYLGGRTYSLVNGGSLVPH